MGEDLLWSVHFFDASDKVIEDIIDDIGHQLGSDRSEPRECMSLNGVLEIRVTVTTSKIEEWHSESVIFEHRGDIIKIGNGAVRDDRFEAFCASFWGDR